MVSFEPFVALKYPKEFVLSVKVKVTLRGSERQRTNNGIERNGSVVWASEINF